MSGCHHVEPHTMGPAYLFMYCPYIELNLCISIYDVCHKRNVLVLVVCI